MANLLILCFFFCDIWNLLSIFKHKLYKDRITKVYVMSALSWFRFRATSVFVIFAKRGVNMFALTKFPSSRLIVLYTHPIYPL